MRSARPVAELPRQELLEALARGLPVVAARIGSVAELIEDARSGVLFAPADARALADAIEGLWRDEDALRRMRENARAAYERSYTPARGRDDLLRVYRHTLEHARARG